MPKYYEEVSNLRVTFIPGEERENSKNWASTDVIRIQAYREPSPTRENHSLHMGSEYPVNSERDVTELLETIRRVYQQGND